MQVLICKNAIYRYFVEDEESDMNDTCNIFIEYFGEEKWILSGTWDEINSELLQIMEKYPMDFILRRFLNSGLAYEIK